MLPNEWGGKAGTFSELNSKYVIFLFHIRHIDIFFTFLFHKYL